MGVQGAVQIRGDAHGDLTAGFGVALGGLAAVVVAAGAEGQHQQETKR